MKRFIFMFFLPFILYAEESKNKNIFDIISKILKKLGDNLTDKIYKASHDIYTNGFVLSFVSVLVVFWVLSKLKGWERKDTYTIFVYAITYIIVLSLLKNKDLFLFVLGIYDFPKNIFNGVIGFIVGADKANPFEIIAIVQNSLTAINIDTGSFWSGYKVANIITYGIFWLTAFFMIVCLAVMIIFSTFTAILIKSLGAIVIPCLLWNKTRGIYFAWLKLYISLTLYAPFAIFISLMAKESSEYASNVTNDNMAGVDSFISIIAVATINLLCIVMLMKIPSWVNQLVGSNNDNDSMGVGTVLKTGMEAMGGLMKGAKRGAGALGGGGNLGSKAGGALGGLIGGPIGSKIGSMAGNLTHKAVAGAGKIITNMRNASSRAG